MPLNISQERVENLLTRHASNMVPPSNKHALAEAILERAARMSPTELRRFLNPNTQGQVNHPTDIEKEPE